MGLHEGMNLGAVRAHQHGIVTSCSVVANGRAFSHAVELLSECPRMSIGAHLTLVEERPVAPQTEVHSLVGGDGLFFADFRAFAARWALGRIRMPEVERELRAQIELLLEAGLRISHLNGHQHLHVLPRIFDIVLNLAGEYGIRYVRIPSDTTPPGTPAARAIAMRFLNVFGIHAKRRRASRAESAATIGIAGAGQMSSTTLIELIERLDSTTAELVCHPGTDNHEIAGTYDWGYDWDGETAALCDPAVEAALTARGVELITPEDLE